MSGLHYQAMTRDKNYLIYGAEGAIHAESPRLANGAISSWMAHKIDSKIDDGKPGSGKVLTYLPTSTFMPDCATTGDPEVATYQLAKTGNICAIAVQF